MSVRFANPPISAVALAVHFDPQLSDFRSEHIGLFWHQIREDFPEVQQRHPYVPPPDRSDDEVFPMPRYWFRSKDGSNSLQIDRNAFVFNWRRRGTGEYPHFHESIKPAFDRYYHLFDEFIRTELKKAPPLSGSCELTYVNTIVESELWSGLEDTHEIIPSFSIPETGVEGAELSRFSFSYIYQISDTMQLTIRGRSFARSSASPALVFEIKASGQLEQTGKAGADEWFDRAHGAIISCFTQTTSKEAQTKLWRLTGES